MFEIKIKEIKQNEKTAKQAEKRKAENGKAKEKRREETAKTNKEGLKLAFFVYPQLQFIQKNSVHIANTKITSNFLKNF